MSKEDSYEVEHIVQARFERRKGRKGHWKYLVKWIGYGEEDNTWQIREDFDGDLVNRFWECIDLGDRDKNDNKQFKNGDVVLAVGSPPNETDEPKTNDSDFTVSKPSCTSGTFSLQNFVHVTIRVLHSADDPKTTRVTGPRTRSTTRTKAVAKRKPEGSLEYNEPVPAKKRVKAVPVRKPIFFEWETPTIVDELGLLESHCGKIMHHEIGTVGKVTFIQIHREKCDKRFLELMKTESDDLGQLATTLFANDGSIRRLLSHNSYKHDWRLFQSGCIQELDKVSKFYRGSDCFDDALSLRHKLLYLRGIELHANIGQKISIAGILSAILDSTFPKGGWVGSIPRLLHQDFNNILALPRELESIYQTCGFRRIARTPYFVFAAGHCDPSRLLPLQNDIKTAHTTPPKFPLHFAISWMEDGTELEATLKASFSTDPASIFQRDTLGYSPLLLACHLDKQIAIRCLLALDPHQTVLRDFDNEDRLTPFKAMLEIYYVRTEQAPIWIEHTYTLPPDVQELMDKLEAATGDPVVSMCTCSVCEKGWLSPRMKVRIQATAERIALEMRDKLICFPARSGTPLDAEEVRKDPYLKYLPSEVRKSVLISVYRGLEGIVTLIWQVLRGLEAGGTIPYVELVKHLTPREYRRGFGRPSESYEMFFHRYGGRTRHVLDCITDVAAKDVAAKDVDKVDESLAKLTNNFPTCANDINFDIVRKKLGLYTAPIGNDEYTLPSEEEIIATRRRNV